MSAIESHRGRTYRIFDVRVRSDHPLAGLPEVPDGPADIRIRVRPGGSPPEADFEWIHAWQGAGSTLLACARRGEEYLLRFPDLGDFHIRPAEQAIDAFPSGTSSSSTITHLLADQVIPRMLGHGGRGIVHASAVALPDGRGLAFFGDTGRGKSTLASSFCSSGARLITDDCLMLQAAPGGITGLAAYPSLRLWPDSMATLPATGARVRYLTHYSNKRQVVLLDAGRIATGPVPLAAVFVLGEPLAGGRILIEPLSGAAAAMALIEAAFVLDVVGPASVQDNFTRMARIARSGPAVHLLRFTHRFDRLPEVRERVLEQVRS
jgi:hypothetical protein